MAWEIKWKEDAVKQFKKLDRPLQIKITKYLNNITDNPRNFGKNLSYSYSHIWRYRVQDHRILCTINDKEVTVYVVKVSHRRDVYDD